MNVPLPINYKVNESYFFSKLLYGCRIMQSFSLTDLSFACSLNLFAISQGLFSLFS